MLLRRGDVDAMLCGTVGTFDEHLRFVREVIGCRTGVNTLAAMNMLMLPDRQIFICDTYVNRHPKAASSSPRSRCSPPRSCAASA